MVDLKAGGRELGAGGWGLGCGGLLAGVCGGGGQEPAPFPLIFEPKQGPLLELGP